MAKHIDYFAKHRTDVEVVVLTSRRGRMFNINISKVGGGTPGKTYTGRWIYEAKEDGRTIASGDDLDIPKEVDHNHAAEELTDRLADDDD